MVLLLAKDGAFGALDDAFYSEICRHQKVILSVRHPRACWSADLYVFRGNGVAFDEVGWGRRLCSEVHYLLRLIFCHPSVMSNRSGHSQYELDDAEKRSIGEGLIVGK